MSQNEQDSMHRLMQQLQQSSAENKIPPLAQWNPSYCGEMDLTILANGEWWHEGRPIRRQKLIDLFATVLWQEDGDYFLKTPVEKIKIKVEDVPLVVNSIDQIDFEGQVYLQCHTQTGDMVLVDADHPIILRDFNGQTRPYIRVRFDLYALIQRQAFYHLVNYGEFDATADQTHLKLKSGDFAFSLSMPNEA